VTTQESTPRHRAQLELASFCLALLRQLERAGPELQRLYAALEATVTPAEAFEQAKAQEAEFPLSLQGYLDCLLYERLPAILADLYSLATAGPTEPDGLSYETEGAEALLPKDATR
jgi:hypothetical protein